jgi:hypothetical protein
MKSPKPYLALAACLAAGLTACATTTPQHAGTAALVTVHAPGRLAHTRAGCPLGRLLPPGVANAVDYVDFLQLGRTFYLAAPEPIKASQLGSVIAHVRCSLTAEEDYRRGAPPIISGTAAFLAAGSAVYQVRGYLPSCRVAAYMDGKLQVYLAQTTVHQHTAPIRCALHQQPG